VFIIFFWSLFGAGTGKVHINDSVCASLVVDPKSLNATVTLIIDGAVLFKDTFSVYDLADVCVPIQVRSRSGEHKRVLFLPDHFFPPWPTPPVRSEHLPELEQCRLEQRHRRPFRLRRHRRRGRRHHHLRSSARLLQAARLVTSRLHHFKQRVCLVECCHFLIVFFLISKDGR